MTPELTPLEVVLLDVLEVLYLEVKPTNSSEKPIPDNAAQTFNFVQKMIGQIATNIYAEE